MPDSRPRRSGIIRYSGSREREAERWMQRLPFPKKYDYVLDHKNPDIIAVGALGITPRSFRRRTLYRTILKQHWRYGGKPVMFDLVGEKDRPSPDVDFNFSYHPTNRKNCLRSFVLDDRVMKPLWPNGGGGGR